MALIFRCAVNPDLKKRHDQLFDELMESPSCYGGYKELCGFLQKYCKASDRIITAGCALSDCSNGESLTEDLYDAGYHSVVGVESSENFVTSSRERNKEKRPEMHFIEGHVLNVRTIAFQYLLRNTTVIWGFKKGLLAVSTSAGNRNHHFYLPRRYLTGIFRFCNVHLFTPPPLPCPHFSLPSSRIRMSGGRCYHYHY